MAKKSICDSYCDGCIFKGILQSDLRVCNYFLATKIRRPCPAGKGCTVKQTGKKKYGWALEYDATWEQKKREPRIKPGKAVFHRECAYCGKKFDTVDSRKIFCSADCRYWRKLERQRDKNPVYHRECKECGTEFDTTNPKKIFCCRECAFKHKQRERYRKKRGIYPNGDANI